MNQAYFDFLNELRETGALNLLGAAPYLQEAFPELDEQKSRAIVTRWMKSFGNQN